MILAEEILLRAAESAAATPSVLGSQAAIAEGLYDAFFVGLVAHVVTLPLGIGWSVRRERRRAR